MDGKREGPSRPGIRTLDGANRPDRIGIDPGKFYFLFFSNEGRVPGRRLTQARGTRQQAQQDFAGCITDYEEPSWEASNVSIDDLHNFMAKTTSPESGGKGLVELLLPAGILPFPA